MDLKFDTTEQSCFQKQNKNDAKNYRIDYAICTHCVLSTASGDQQQPTQNVTQPQAAARSMHGSPALLKERKSYVIFPNLSSGRGALKY